MRRWRVTAACILATATAIACIARIAYVNESFPDITERSFGIGDAAFYSGEDSSGQTVVPGEVRVTVTGFRAIGYDGLKALVPDYEDSLIDGGPASDMRAFLVEVALDNHAREARTVHVRDFSLESGAWTNGLYTPVYVALNEDPATIVTLAPGQTEKRTLVYLAYDIQTNSPKRWKRLLCSDFSLILSLFPEKCSVKLGCPAQVDFDERNCDARR